MSDRQTVPLLLAKDIDWSRLNPCGDCPFLKTTPFHEGVAGSIPTYIESMENNVFAHTCHKTDNRETCDGPRNWKGERTQHCAGAILMLLKSGRGIDLQLPLLQAAERGDLDLKEATEKAKAATNIFTVSQFLAFYGNELRKRLDTPAARAALRRADRKAKKRKAKQP